MMTEAERERIVAVARATTPAERLAAMEALLWELGIVERADEMRRLDERLDRPRN